MVKLMFVSRTFKRIKITVRTSIAKPGNGQMARGNMKNLLLVYNPNGGKEGKRYLVKGLRGVLNHAMMELAKQREIEVCHISDKKTTQKGEPLLPEGYHLNGSCYPEEECIRHKLMGSLKKQSVVRFNPVIITSDNIKEEINDAQKVHLSTEIRNALMKDSKRSTQDFRERFIAGEFNLEIELLKELDQELLGFLLKSILYMPEIRWGASANNGAGKIDLLEVNLQEVTRTRTVKKGKVIEKESEQNLWKEMDEVLKAWK